jgi:hypothetical protein
MNRLITRTHNQDRALFAPLVASIACMAACSGTPSEVVSEQTLEGRLQTVVVGDRAIERSHFEYFLQDERGDWVKLEFDQRPDLLEGEAGHEHLALPGHSQGHGMGQPYVRVTGLLEGDRVHVTTLEHAADASDSVGSTTEALITASPRKVAVILANFSNNTTQPITAAAARDLVFGGAQSANAYFKEVSFGIRSLVGKIATTGDVFGWYTIASSNNPCDYSAWGSAARAAAQSAGVDLSGYDHIVHYFPKSSACAWSGVGQVPGKYTWINGSSSSTITHELGHNFGSHHAASLACKDASGAPVSISTTCTSSEYGNPYDVMGRGYRHMTVFNKGRVGFLEPENTVTATDATFEIKPLEQKSTGIQALRVRIDASTAYYVEFRQSFGFDTFPLTSNVTQGVLITRAPLAYTTLAMPALLDMVPSTVSLNDAALVAGKTFTDAAAGISIRVNSVSTAGANVTVDVP